MTSTTASSLRRVISPLENVQEGRHSLQGLPLEGEGITIREFRRSDEETRQKWAKFADFYLLKYNFMPQAAADNDLTFHRLKDRIRLAVENSASELIGYVSLKAVKKDPGAAELGICFAADQVSRGFGRQVLELILPWATRVLKLRRILLEVDAVNSRALRLYRRFGFRPVSQTWKREDNPALREYVSRCGPAYGIRYQHRRLELLSWRMEWRAPESIPP